MSTPSDYSRNGDVLRIRYDWSSTSPSTAVIEAVAFAKNQDPTGLEPLHEYVDFDALDTLVDSGRTLDAGQLSLSFEFEDQQVVVHQSGTVVVQPIRTIR